MWIIGLMAAQAQTNNFNSQSWCFGSGLRVIFEEDHQRPEVRITTLVEGGSGGESAENAGLAHLIEHLWFRSQTPSGAQVQSYQAARGIRANAFTNADVTGFTSTGPKGVAKQLLALEAQRLVDPLHATESFFEIERGIVSNELRENYTDVTGSAMQGVFTTIYPAGHPYQHLTIGTPSSISSLTMEAARSYADTWYRPEHTTVYLSGDLDPDKVPDMIGVAFKDHLLHPTTHAMMGTVDVCGDRKRALPPEPKSGDPDTPVVIQGNTMDRTAILAWHVKNEDEVLAAFALRLMGWKIRQELEIPAECSLRRQRLGSVGLCTLGLEAGDDASKVLKKAMRETNNQWQPDHREWVKGTFEAYKLDYMVGLYQALERRGGHMVAEHFHQTGLPDWLQSRLKGRDITDFSLATKYALANLGWKQATTFDVVPGETIEVGAPALHDNRAATNATTLDPAKVDRAFLDAILAEPDWKSARTYPLKNGAKAVLMPFGSFDVIHSLITHPSPGAEPTPGLDLVAWSSLPYPPGNLYSAANRLLGDLSVSSASSGSWRYGVSGVKLEGQLELLQHTLATQEVTNAASVRRAFTERESTTAYGRAATARTEALLPGVALSEAQALASIASIKPKDVKSWAAAKLDPSNAHLIVVGKIDPTTAIRSANHSIGSIKGRAGKAGASGTPVTLPPIRAVTYAAETDKPRSQVTLTLSCRTDAAGPVTSQVVAGLIEARAATLRQNQGLTYGVYARAHSDVAGRVVDIRTDVEREGLKSALKELRGAVEALAQEGPSDAELAMARVLVAGSYASDFQRASQLTAILAAYADQGVAPDAIGAFSDQLMAVDAAKVRAALGTCKGHEVVTVVTSEVESLLTQVGEPYTFLPAKD